MKVVFSFFAILVFSLQTIVAQTPQELKSYMPELAGWTLVSEVEVFSPDNLFDRINGAAPLFLENNFQEMTSMEYKKGDDYITVQVYRHATPEDTFGMYASERSTDLTYYPIGGEAQGDAANLYFFAGNIYVKMWGNSAEDLNPNLQAIAKALAAKADPDAGYPAVLQAFPAEDKVPYSETYITSNFIGHEFLRGVYTTDYKKDGKTFQAFVIDGRTTAGAKEVLEKYFAFTKQPQEFTEGPQTITDRYNGDIPVIWDGRYVVGVFSANGDAMPGAEAFLKGIAEKL